jgi:hypothetical protein
MPRRVKGPDGKIHQFPDEATDAQISGALKAIPEVNAKATPKAPTWSDQLGLNTPTESVAGGFLRGAGAGAVDMVQGAVSNVAGQLNAKLDAENVGREAPTATLPRVEKPETFSGTVGSALPVVGEMALGGAPVVRAGLKAIPSAARAGEKFQDVMGAAKNIPIDVKDVGDVALRISQLAERGGSMPLAVRKILNRMTDPEKAPMAYEEARDFASNISRLSADEFGRLTPAIAREVAALRVALNQANAMAAKQAGKWDEYRSAMTEYARAMKLQKLVDTTIDAAKRGIPLATAGGAAYWMTNRLRSAFGGE